MLHRVLIALGLILLLIPGYFLYNNHKELPKQVATVAAAPTPQPPPMIKLPKHQSALEQCVNDKISADMRNDRLLDTIERLNNKIASLHVTQQQQQDSFDRIYDIINKIVGVVGSILTVIGTFLALRKKK